MMAAKITIAQVHRMRADRAAGLTYEAIARKYDVSLTTARRWTAPGEADRLRKWEAARTARNRAAREQEERA